jgi:hypothetical protein
VAVAKKNKNVFQRKRWWTWTRKRWRTRWKRRWKRRL